jgi:hypothetical protein
MTELSQADERLREAREQLASFIDKRALHEKKLAQLGRARSELAFDAHRGDGKARKRLDALHLEAAKADSEFLSLDSAIAEAHVRVSSAEELLRQAQTAANATTAATLLEPLEADGQLVDRLIAQLLQGLDQLRSDVRTLRSLGAHPCSEAAMRVAINRALESALSSEMADLPLHRPSERKSFSELARLWIANCRTVLGKHEQEAA